MKYFSGITDRPAAAARYRELAKLHHPDAGGDADIMQEVNREWDEWQILEKHGFWARREVVAPKPSKGMPKPGKTPQRARNSVRSQPHEESIRQATNPTPPQPQAPPAAAQPTLNDYLRDGRQLVRDVQRAVADFSSLVQNVMDLFDDRRRDPD